MTYTYIYLTKWCEKLWNVWFLSWMKGTRKILIVYFAHNSLILYVIIDFINTV